MFNAIKYTQELERAGFTREQAEVSVKLLIDSMNENLATKSDFSALKQELDMKIESTKLELRSEIRELEYKLTIKLGSMMALAIGVTATLVKILPSVHV
jgi:hypothetical protein